MSTYWQLNTMHPRSNPLCFIRSSLIDLRDIWK